MIDSSGEATRRAEASLVYDTKTQPLSPGVRAVAHRGRRLLFTCDQTELLLQIDADRRTQHARLVGEILDDGMPVPGAAISVTGTSGVHRLVTDDGGQFRLADLATDSYGLEIEIDSRVICIPSLDVA